MQRVLAWEEDVIIPTYRVGEPDRNPMFLEKRVYQGSSGVVYPHPVIDKVYDEKEDKRYHALYLENEYLKVMVLPELGGRIQMAYDKLHDYHFVYHNRVIKPALVGLTGPWISGGIEFNWPQHHRPSTFEPVDCTITEQADGSCTIWVSEIEIMFHTKGMAGITLRPGRACIEIRGQLYNRTPFPQSFLWWANPAVHVNEHYQSVFPPDVHAVYDHGRRDVSSFPVARGVYYKVDYSPGTDISRYTNIPVPTSYMAVNSAFDFVGGYDHGRQAGILHVADHHVSPGKKQWTWGSGEFGRSWDRQLTDADGPYFELMTGVYTDNQPDFSWIMPNEERVFTQYFMPYHGIGYVKNASAEAALNLEVSENTARIRIYVTAPRTGLHIVLRDADGILAEDRADLDPGRIYDKSLALPPGTAEQALRLELTDGEGRLLLAYSPVSRGEEPIPEPAKPIAAPADIGSVEDLYLAGLHLEQYRHATFAPPDYYGEGLRRDPTDIRCNNALGRWYLRRGRSGLAEPFFRRAIEKLCRHNPNPYDGEPYYNLGLCLAQQERWDEAYDAFFKACWNAAWQDSGYLQLAYIDCRRGAPEKALEHLEHSLARNHHGMQARHLKAALLRRLGRPGEAAAWAAETLRLDPFDFGSRYERWKSLLDSGKDEAAQEGEQLSRLLRGWAHSHITLAIDYARAGWYDEAVEWLRMDNGSHDAMLHYYLGYYLDKAGRSAEAEAALDKAAALPPDRVFPNRLEDIRVLEFAMQRQPGNYKACYSLGNLWYDKRQYEEARACWERAVSLCEAFASAHRNLGIAWYNKFGDPQRALEHYEKAFRCNPGDARVLFELDQLYRRLNRSPEDRLALLQQHPDLVRQRDDLYTEYLTLYNLLGRYEEAAALLAGRRFHPWEGGEGKVSGQYVQNRVALARQALDAGDCQAALDLLDQAQHYPENLGEGKLYGAQENDVHYWSGCAHAAMGADEEARACWEKAALGLSEPAAAVYYNDQPPEKIFYQGLALRRLGRDGEAMQRFGNLIRYGQEHMDDRIRIDFFAVSLPDLMVFDTDLDLRNRIHCHYLLGLGYLGSDDQALAAEHLQQVLDLDASHLGARIHRAWTVQSVR